MSSNTSKNSSGLAWISIVAKESFISSTSDINPSIWIPNNLSCTCSSAKIKAWVPAITSWLRIANSCLNSGNLSFNVSNVFIKFSYSSLSLILEASTSPALIESAKDAALALAEAAFTPSPTFSK